MIVAKVFRRHSLWLPLFSIFFVACGGSEVSKIDDTLLLSESSAKFVVDEGTALTEDSLSGKAFFDPGIVANLSDEQILDFLADTVTNLIERLKKSQIPPDRLDALIEQLEQLRVDLIFNAVFQAEIIDKIRNGEPLFAKKCKKKRRRRRCRRRRRHH